MKLNRYLIILLFQTVGWASISSLATTSKGGCLPSTTDAENPFLKLTLEGEKIFLEIPHTLLQEQMLFVRHNDGYQVGSIPVIWTRFRDRIFLETIRIESLTGVKIPISNNPDNTTSILATFPIMKEKSTSESYFIEISEVLLTDQIDYYRTAHEAIIKDLTFVKKVKNLSNEVLIKTIWGVARDQDRITIPVDFSFFRLPEPMNPRRFDYRMGFWSEKKPGGEIQLIENSTASILRWRLDKKDSNQAISTPKKPILFTLSPEIPKKWRPYIKAGILAWLPAFEAAGFKDALVVKDPVDGHSEDAEFFSVNESVVRWGSTRNVRGYENVGGATITEVIDQRTGEILKSDILINSSLQYLMDSYFIRCAPMDKRTHQYPFPDALIGEILQSLVSHEAGHSFGLIDGNYGEYAYPFDKMRDEDWLTKMGHTPSIMTYARDNNLVQPEDNIDPSVLIQKVGPTDRYSIKWGYTPFKAIDSIQEKDFLEAVIREQDTVLWYRRNKSFGEIIGPGATNEVVENNDPIRSTELALKNLERVMALIPKVNRDKKDYELLERLYERSLQLWNKQMQQVLSLIGGYDIKYKVPDQLGSMYTSIPFEVQYKALNFFLIHAFNPPDWLAYPEWKHEIRYSTYPDRINALQIGLLADLLSPMRMKRLEHIEEGLSNKTFCKNIMARIQESLFKELSVKNVVIDRRRQEIQNFYVERIVFGLAYKGELSVGDVQRALFTQNTKSIFYQELMLLKKTIAKEINKTNSDSNKGHLSLLLLELNKLE